MSQPPLLELPPDEAPPAALRYMQLRHGLADPGCYCGDCSHYGNGVCYCHGATIDDWPNDQRGCSLYEYAEPGA